MIDGGVVMDLLARRYSMVVVNNLHSAWMILVKERYPARRNSYAHENLVEHERTRPNKHRAPESISEASLHTVENSSIIGA